MKVHSKRETLESLGATAVFIAFDAPAVLRRTLLADVDLLYPVLVDRDRSAYAAWGLSRVAWHRVWLDPRVWRTYVHLLREGFRWRGMGSDTRQLGGDFVVARDGRIAYCRPQQRDDRPPVGELLAVVAQQR